MGIIPLSYIEGYKCHSSQNKKNKKFWINYVEHYRIEQNKIKKKKYELLMLNTTG
jgi:hypothetical protein